MTAIATKLVNHVKAKNQVFAKVIVSKFDFSPRAATTLATQLAVDSKPVVKAKSSKKQIRSAPNPVSQTKCFYAKTFQNVDIDEIAILYDVERNLWPSLQLPENIRSIFAFIFSKILNNVKEHSRSRQMKILAAVARGVLTVTIEDFGIGIFRNIMQASRLHTETAAIQEILKGKVTSIPHQHAGEGLFFAVRAADQFIIDSYGYRVCFRSARSEIAIEQTKRIALGTKVTFKINLNTKRNLANVLKKYLAIADDGGYQFNTTEISLKLYAKNRACTSIAEARHVLYRLENFKRIKFNYIGVSKINHEFANEIYQAFHSNYPEIKLENSNMNCTIKRIIEKILTKH